MSLEDGLLLFLIGMGMTIPGLFLAYYYGSKEPPKDDTPDAIKELRKTLDK